MNLMDIINDNLKTAMKSKDRTRLSVLRMLKSAIKYDEIARGEKSEDGDIVNIIQREIKKRKESIECFRTGKREDLAEKEEAEMAVLFEYLPAQATDGDIRSVVKTVMDAIPEGTKINMGMIMPEALEKLKGKADGKRISQIVREFFQ